jgi:hypothetical protein
MGQPGTEESESQWYLIARRGVVRVRQGMPVGETAAGKLSFDPACAQLEIDVAEDGGLVLRGVDDHELASPVGTRHRRERLTRYRRAELRLPHNIVQIEPDFVDGRHSTATVELRVVRPDEEITEPRFWRISDAWLEVDRFITFSRDALRRSIDRTSGVLPFYTADRVEPKLGEPWSHRAPSSPDPDQPGPGDGPTQHRVEPAGAHRLGMRGVLTAALVGLAGVGVVLLYSANRDGGETGSHVGGTAPQAASPAGSAVAGSSERNELPGVPLAMAPRFPALDMPPALEPKSPPGEATAKSPPAEATTKSPPAEATAQSSLAAKTVQGSPAEATAETALPEPIAERPRGPLPKSGKAAAPAVEPIERTSAERPSIAQVAVPARNDKAKTSGTQERVSGVVREPREENGATNRRSAAEAGRALIAADQALADGRLTTPKESSAYTLYKRVLAIDPGSAAAKRGLQSVRDGVINRALAELANSRLDDARRSLKTAAEVGADPLLLANLQNEVDQRQRVTGERVQ